jgi:hypothetical protein
MTHLTIKFSDKISKKDADKLLGQKLASELEAAGYIILSPSHTDWGYVFKVELNKRTFEVMIAYDRIHMDEATVTVHPVLTIWQKLFGTKDHGNKIIEQAILDILNRYSTMWKIVEITN